MGAMQLLSVETARVDRLAHPRPADSSHASLLFVEARAIGVERQFQVGEQALQSRVEIGDPVRRA
jgi:hypothetical protein